MGSNGGPRLVLSAVLIASLTAFVKTEYLKILALTGRHDPLSDGVWDYCTRLSAALREHGADMGLSEVAWEERGWPTAVCELWNRLSRKRSEWALLQYTAMAWSRRGFPFGALAVAWIAKHRGARLAVVFHESFGFRAKGIWARSRFGCQQWVIRRLFSIADVGIFTVPLASLPWLRHNDAKACFIPIGANIPAMLTPRQLHTASPETPKTVAVFCVTTVRKTEWEVAEITAAVRHAMKAVPRLRLVVFGRGATEARSLLEDALADISVELTILGVISPEEITRILSESDALLYVRDTLTPQHGSALAAVACGLPLVAYGDEAGCSPLSEAGILLAPPGDRNALYSALERVLTDDAFWTALHNRSVNAYKKYFAWEEIARKYATALQVLASAGSEDPVHEAPRPAERSRVPSLLAEGGVKEELRSGGTSNAI